MDYLDGEALSAPARSLDVRVAEHEFRREFVRDVVHLRSENGQRRLVVDPDADAVLSNEIPSYLDIYFGIGYYFLLQWLRKIANSQTPMNTIKPCDANVPRVIKPVFFAS